MSRAPDSHPGHRILESMDAPQKRLSAGVVIIRETADGPRFLLLRAYKHWDFPKGMVEADETPFAAAQREVAEETGIEALEFAWGEVFRETAPYARGKVARYYIARTEREDVALTPNPLTG